MQRHFASALTLATATAAVACAAAIASGNAYAEGPIIDNTPFVSTRTRAEVQAELMGQRHLLSAAAGEWAMQNNQASQPMSGYTRAQAKAQVQAARAEVSALTSEDSGSSYFARAASRSSAGTVVAVKAR